VEFTVRDYACTPKLVNRQVALISFLRWSSLVCAMLLPFPAVPQLAHQNAARAQKNSVQHVLLLSLDGMHSLDVANLIKSKPGSALAKLNLHAVNYSNALTTFPSNSWPGLLSMVTGGSPNVTGIIFENSYDRSLSAPKSDCTVNGTAVVFDSSIDKNRDQIDGGGGIDPDKLPRDPKKGCSPVYPHNFLRVNTVFEVIKKSGGRTAWSDKHPAYDLVNGPSGMGVDDLFTPEIRNVHGGKNVELYDDSKVAALLHEIDGKDHTGTTSVGVPAIFGMNFQAISVAQKSEGGGYVDGAGTPSQVLEEAFAHTDQSIGKIIARLQERGLIDSTLVILTAKHGDSPIDPAKLKRADLELIPKTVDTIQKGLLANLEQDGSIAMLWLSDQDRTEAVATALRKIQDQAGIQELYSGESLKLLFNDPRNDPRVPDIIIQPTPGQIYVDSAFVAEHGGNALTDRNVPLLVFNPRFSPAEIKVPIQTSQIAPTILRALGLNPNSLDAVRRENTPLLPGLSFPALVRSKAP
jgi:predicted AlkP superfamily pyrophosphatase or phosphodiesterase